MSGVALSRRGFIGVSLVAGGGLVFDLAVPTAAKAADSEPVLLTAFIRILPGNRFVIGGKNAEIGQGAKTTLPMMIAEELDIDWDQLSVEQTHADQALFGAQSAGGSRTTGREWIPMRQAGAAARAMLLAAAARQWSVAEGELSTASGVVHHRASGRSIAYVDLAATAVDLAPPDPETLKLKDPAAYRIIGKAVRGVDTPDIVAGKPLFGIDVTMPGLLNAVLETCPVVGGKLKSANLDEIRALPGVSHVLTIEGDGEAESLLDGVAILSESWWSANQARSRLKVEWDDSAQRGFSTDGYERQAAAKLAGSADADVIRAGDVEAAFATAGKLVAARYSYPFLAHGTLEPQNCTALFEDGKLEIWAPTQNPEIGRGLVAKAMGIAPEDIRINMTRVGGGFGRRLMNDYMVQAAAIARQVPGTPVKVLYNRQDEFRRDFFRPAGWHSFRAALDEQGRLTAFHDHFVTFGKGGQPNRAANLPATALPAGLIDNLLFEHSLLDTNLPSGWLRAPGSNGLAFAFQGFLDEVAEAAGKDLPALMLELLGQPREIGDGRGPGFLTGRASGVIERVVAMSGWADRDKLPEGHGKGFAFFFSHAGYFAEVVEVAVQQNVPRVVKVWAAGDVGSQIVNPLNAEQQVHGSIIEGLGQAMAGQKVTQVNGAVEQANYDRHPFMRIGATPAIEVEYITTDNPPTGLGEPALPPVIPAMTNAIYAATGKRVRNLPVDLHADA